VNPSDAPAVCNELSRGGEVTLGSLIRDPWDRGRELGGIFLLLERDQNRKLLPDAETRLQEGDRLLVCGSGAAFTRMNWSLKNDHTLAYVRTGEDRHVGWLWRKFGRATKDRESSV
jgi:hypothetical protein